MHVYNDHVINFGKFRNLRPRLPIDLHEKLFDIYAQAQRMQTPKHFYPFDVNWRREIAEVTFIGPGWRGCSTYVSSYPSWRHDLINNTKFQSKSTFLDFDIVGVDILKTLLSEIADFWIDLRRNGNLETGRAGLAYSLVVV